MITVTLAMKKTVLATAFSFLLGSTVHAGDPRGVIELDLPPISERPSDLGFKPNRSAHTAGYTRTGPIFEQPTKDQASGASKEPKTNQPAQPSFTHPQYPGLFFEGTGDLGLRLKALDKPIGKPRIISLLGADAEGTKRLMKTLDKGIDISIQDWSKKTKFTVAELNPDKEPFPILLAHFHVNSKGTPFLGTPDGKNLSEWAEIQKGFSDQGTNPIILACNSNCLSEANFGVSTPIDVNEVEIALKDIHTSKTLGELLSQISKVSPQGLTVRTVGYGGGGNSGEPPRMIIEGFGLPNSPKTGFVIFAAIILLAADTESDEPFTE